MERPDKTDSVYFNANSSFRQMAFDLSNKIYIDKIEAENKSLREALKAIAKVTEDEELPLPKVIHQIASKTLKAVK